MFGYRVILDIPETRGNVMAVLIYIFIALLITDKIFKSIQNRR